MPFNCFVHDMMVKPVLAVVAAEAVAAAVAHVGGAVDCASALVALDVVVYSPVFAV